MPKTKSFSGIVVILLIFLSLGLCYSYYTPLWNPPDEERHFAYCEYIALNHKLPDYTENSVYMAFHPPLYYLFGSLLCKDDGRLLEEEISVNDGPGFIDILHPEEETEFPYSGKSRSAHLLRLFSLALSALNIYFIYLLVLKIFPSETILASTTALFVATIPQFVHVSASISNENLAVTFSTAYLLSLLNYLENPLKLVRSIISGLLLGFCLLSKTSTIFYLPVTICIITWICLQHRRNPIPSLFVIFGMASFVAGWWYLRNWFISNDIFLTRTAVSLHPWFLRRIPLSLNDWRTMIAQIFTSFFGYFGSLQFSIQDFHLCLYGGITLLGITGLCYSLAKGKMTAFQGTSFGILFLSLLGGTGIFIFLNIKYMGLSMGRYLFVVIAPIALLTFVGLWSLFTPRWRNSVLMVVSLSLIVLNLDVLLRVLKPAYADISLVKGVDQPIFCCPTTEMSSAVTIGQTFIAQKNNLSAIRVMFSSPQKLKDGEIIFSLLEGRNTRKLLYQIDLPLKAIDDWTRYFFIFPPIKDSMGKEYTFYFDSPSLRAGNGISLWHDARDVYTSGKMLVNSTPTVGDLYFTTYCFTGEHPQTDWEGRRLTAIKQGQYITIREWQLYNERSRDFRRKTITHEKLKRFQAALDYRKSMTK